MIFSQIVVLRERVPTHSRWIILVYPTKFTVTTQAHLNPITLQHSSGWRTTSRLRSLTAITTVILRENGSLLGRTQVSRRKTWRWQNYDHSYWYSLAIYFYRSHHMHLCYSVVMLMVSCRPYSIYTGMYYWCMFAVWQVSFLCSIPDPIKSHWMPRPPVHACMHDWLGKMAAIRCTCACLSIVVLLLAVKAEARSFTIDYDKDTFMKDGQPFRSVLANVIVVNTLEFT